MIGNPSFKDWISETLPERRLPVLRRIEKQIGKLYVGQKKAEQIFFQLSETRPTVLLIPLKTKYKRNDDHRSKEAHSKRDYKKQRSKDKRTDDYHHVEKGLKQDHEKQRTPDKRKDDHRHEEISLKRDHQKERTKEKRKDDHRREEAHSKRDHKKQRTPDKRKDDHCHEEISLKRDHQKERTPDKRKDDHCHEEISLNGDHQKERTKEKKKDDHRSEEAHSKRDHKKQRTKDKRKDDHCSEEARSKRDHKKQREDKADKYYHEKPVIMNQELNVIKDRAEIKTNADRPKRSFESLLVSSKANKKELGTKRAEIKTNADRPKRSFESLLVSSKANKKELGTKRTREQKDYNHKKRSSKTFESPMAERKELSSKRRKLEYKLPNNVQSVLEDYTRDTPSLTPSEIDHTWKELMMIPPRRAASPFWKEISQEPELLTVPPHVHSPTKDTLERGLTSSSSLSPIIELVKKVKCERRETEKYPLIEEIEQINLIINESTKAGSRVAEIHPEQLVLHDEEIVETKEELFDSTPFILPLVVPQIVKQELNKKPVLLNLVPDINEGEFKRPYFIDKMENKCLQTKKLLVGSKSVGDELQIVSVENIQFDKELKLSEEPVGTSQAEKSCLDRPLFNLVPFDMKPIKSSTNVKAQVDSTSHAATMNPISSEARTIIPLLDSEPKMESNRSEVKKISDSAASSQINIGYEKTSLKLRQRIGCNHIKKPISITKQDNVDAVFEFMVYCCRRQMKSLEYNKKEYDDLSIVSKSTVLNCPRSIASLTTVVNPTESVASLSTVVNPTLKRFQYASTSNRYEGNLNVFNHPRSIASLITVVNPMLERFQYANTSNRYNGSTNPPRYPHRGPRAHQPYNHIAYQPYISHREFQQQMDFRYWESLISSSQRGHYSQHN